MKAFFMLMFITFFSHFSKAQQIASVDLTGVFLIDRYPLVSLIICENNKWFYTTCSVPTFPTHSNSNNCGSIIEARGGYSLEDSILYLRGTNDSLLVKLKVVDTLNLLVIFTKGIFKTGEYINRTLCYFPGYSCTYYIENMEFVRWEISDGKLYRYYSLGGFFRSKNSSVETLPEGYWRSNEDN
ncbi:MAG TPA: hypothetical protein DEO70_05735 [Bacteroidales bacterium]|nr:MAG: hypothetical protein A2X11_10895 [Bacteroidetes bacterium GWE2_42_24]OFY32054.1 MAG: hypothetical protein A2X09_10460 [Bacteroidetes bacterium GWF2_43_11]HBZ66321.1 hypothetical protein [Bacteroidales bacterium]